MERYLTANDVAAELGVTETTVLNMVKREELPVVAETLSGIRLYRLEDVRHLADERAALGKRGRRSRPALPVSEAVAT